VGGGLEVGDVTGGLGGVERPHSREGIAPPFAVSALPVEGRLPAPGLDGRPTEREPELRPAVAPVLDELEVLAVGDGSIGELEWLEESSVAGALVVIGEAAATVTDRVHATRVIDPAEGLGGRRGGFRARAVGRTERVH